MPFLIGIGKIRAWKVLLSKLLWNANNAAVMTIALPVFTLTGRFYMPSSSCIIALSHQ
jgi:hypothetical protein